MLWKEIRDLLVGLYRDAHELYIEFKDTLLNLGNY